MELENYDWHRYSKLSSELVSESGTLIFNEGEPETSSG